MLIFILILSSLFIWLLFEVWRAPAVEEGPEDTITWIEEPKRLRDIFKK